jgi:cell fate (sporulation/competence/biofilm development) regulator YlbF (YheA/YmcA/DUF963 family)
MNGSNDLLQAAQDFGAALRETPAVQAYLAADAALRNDPAAQHLEAELERVYRDLVKRQQDGQMVFSNEVNHFYQLRDAFVNHPLVIRRQECLRVVKALFEQAGGTLNSILSVDYTQLVNEE